MNFKLLIKNIATIHSNAQRQAALAVNQSLTIRNWIIGRHIVEYEQNGSDRQKYGSKLALYISDNAKKNGVKGLSETNLKLCKRFYIAYPQLEEIANSFFTIDSKKTIAIRQTLSAEFNVKSKSPIRQTASAEFKMKTTSMQIPANAIIEQFSFSHIVELLRIEEPIEKLFYELQTIKESWSVDELTRAIKTQLYERTGLSKDKTNIIKKLKSNKIQTIEERIRNPYVLEFINLPQRPEYSESDLENEIINHIQKFIFELGKGFCFEARQKRITVGNKHNYVDLVFYHRILKCHVLIELKIGQDIHTAVGQMNSYVNYYNTKERQKNDNPPIGIIMMANEDEIEIEFALGGLSNKIFVSKYKVALPSERSLKNFIRNDLQQLYKDLNTKITKK